MNEKWITGGLTLTFCALVGGSLYALPWGNPRMTKSAGTYLRIELPPVTKIEPDQLTVRDALVISREAGEEQKSLAATETTVGIGIAGDPSGEVEALSTDVAANVAEIAQTGRPNELLELSFDLSNPYAQSNSAMELRKNVRFNGTDAGTATIRVGSGSALFIASGDLRTMLVAAKRGDLAEDLSQRADGSFVGFDEIRQNGLNLRYDPVADRILISG